MNWYLKVLKQYSDFDGRARRMEYWMFTLVNALIIFAAEILIFILGLFGTLSFIPLVVLVFLYGLIMIIPGLAVAVRRLHDTGKSGWMILISLIPLIGGIWLLILFLTDSQPGSNQYGENPKGIENYR